MEEVEDVYKHWNQAMLKLKGQCDTDEMWRQFHESQRLVEDVVQYSQPQASHKVCNFQPLQPDRLKAVNFYYCIPGCYFAHTYALKMWSYSNTELIIQFLGCVCNISVVLTEWVMLNVSNRTVWLMGKKVRITVEGQPTFQISENCHSSCCTKTMIRYPHRSTLLLDVDNHP